MKRISDKTKDARGYGKGEGAGYQPYIQAHEFNSQGTAVTLPDYITGRSVELLSQGEAQYWHTLRFDDDVIEIREQVPLPKEETNRIAEELGCPPVNNGRTKMTTDFFVVYADGHGEAHSFKKNKRSLERQRSLEKLTIEKLFWESKGVTYRLVLGTDVNVNYAESIRICSYFYNPQKVVSPEDCLKHLIIRKIIKVDMKTSIIDVPALTKQYRKEIDEWMSSR